MSGLSKGDVGIIRTALKKRADRVKLTSAWQRIHDDFQIGHCVERWLQLSRKDHRELSLLCVRLTGVDPLLGISSGGRTEVAGQAFNEKWADGAVRDGRIFVSALNSGLILNQGIQVVSPGTEYRVQVDDIQLDAYEALVVVENLGAYIHCQSFCWPELGPALVIYRGHEGPEERAVQKLLNEQEGERPVYAFYDPDPAGIGMVMDLPYATHAIVPPLDTAIRKRRLQERFSKQLAARPNLKQQSADFPQVWQSYVEELIDGGIASSQEWLCNARVGLRIIDLEP
jgi:hypothetical protein